MHSNTLLLSEKEARNRNVSQNIEMNCLETLDSDEYLKSSKKPLFDLNECYFVMLRKENALPPYKVPSASYLKYRRYLIDWASEKGDKFGLSKLSIHSACHYLDTLLAPLESSPGRDKLKWIATCCLHIAAKYEDAEENLPRLSSFGMGHSKADLRNSQIQILKAYVYPTMLSLPLDIHLIESTIDCRLNWKLSILTPIHILGVHLKRGVFFPNDHLNAKPVDAHLDKVYRSYVEFFNDFMLQQNSCRQYRPSVLAASILCVSRKALHIHPIWRRELATLTDYEFDEIESCVENMWSQYVRCFPSAVPVDKTASPTSVHDFPDKKY